jgi:P-type conjugative transfer protein TrbG
MTPARLLLAAAAALPLLLPLRAAAAPGPGAGQAQVPAAQPSAAAPVPSGAASAQASDPRAPSRAEPPSKTTTSATAAAPAPDAAGGVEGGDLPLPSRAEPAGKAARSTAAKAAAPALPPGSGDGRAQSPPPSASAREPLAGSAAPTQPPPPSTSAAAPHAQAKPSPTAPADAAAPADPESLSRAYRRTGVAPSVERATESLVPFGHVRPVLRCAPLRACVVVLEAGELVLSTSLGDGERWLVQAAASGAGARTPILVVKPIACDLSTNLVVATDRRIYELALDSPPCRNADSGDSTYNPRLQYTGLTRFYYPDELVRRWTGEEELARAEAERASEGRTPLAPAARLAHLNFDYSWDRGRRWPWVPQQVFDDGEHTYLALSPAARLADMPLLFALGPRGELTLINHHLEGQTLIADRVLERAVLVVGAASKRDAQRLEIVNRAYPASAASASIAARR